MATQEKKQGEGASAVKRDLTKSDQSSRTRGALARYGRFEPFSGIREEFERLFDRYFPSWPSGLAGPSRSDHWGLDLDETDDSVVVRAEAPGFEPDEFDLQVRGNQLIICGSHEDNSGEGQAPGGRWEKQELYRAVTLSADVNPDKVDASYHNGVLTVTLPKSTPTNARRIAVHG